MATRVQFPRVEPTVPYSVMARRERSRDLAQKRRTTYKSLMSDLAQELPFSKDVISQVDYNSRLRLALAFFKMKSVVQEKEMDKEKQLEVFDRKPSFQAGMLQDLITEAMDGFLLVTLSDGTIIYLSESIHKHLGLFQSEHIGFSIYDLIYEEDHNDVKTAIEGAEAKAFSRLSAKGSVECSFFCRMKCSRFKVANTITKSPGYKLVFASGNFKALGSDPFLVVVIRPVSPPSILEIRMEGNMYVTHYNLDFKCTFYDGRLRHLLGYNKTDLIGHTPFELHHHEDTEVTLDCSRQVMSKGEGLSAYYRYLTQFGQYIWIQSRATLMFDSRTGKPSYLVCMNFVISKENGEKSLALRRAITAGETKLSQDGDRSLDPFPIPRKDGNTANPLEADNKVTGVQSASSITVDEEPTSTENHYPSRANSNSTTIPLSSSSSPPVSVSSPHSSLVSTSIPQRSGSSSPDECIPDSTTSASLPPPLLNKGHHLSASTDAGYHSGSLSSRASSSLFSPRIDSSEHDLSSPLSHPEVFTSPPQRQQASPEDLFSPMTSVGKASPLQIGFKRPQSATNTSGAIPYSTVSQVSFPDSIPNTSPYSSSTYFDPRDVKYNPGTSVPFQVPPENASGSYGNTGVHVQREPWNMQSFIKQEPPDFEYEQRYHSVNTQQNFQGIPVPKQPDRVSFAGGVRTSTTNDMITASVIFNIPVSGPSSMSSGPSSNPTLALPLLTGEDLQVLDYIDQFSEDSSVRQMPQYTQFISSQTQS